MTNNLPELNFATADPEKLLDAAKTICEGILGRTLSRADPLMLFLKSLIAVNLQLRLLIDETAKLNLLYYSSGDALDHIGLLMGVYRLPASAATCSAKVTLSAPMTHAVTIAKGTRINAGDNINFAMDDDLTFLAGETELTAKFICVEVGDVGNGYAVGELNKIVDPQAYLLSIENISATEGGADIESDDNFRERIRIAPESFSTAGPTGAYEYFTKQASSLITDVFITSENPGEVDVYFLLEGGELPGDEMIELVYQTLSDRTVRPLTDHLFVKVPEVVNFDIDLVYFISFDDASAASTIQTKINSAVDDFIVWQKSKIGRDINKTELEYRIRLAGAKRVEITLPQFTTVADNQVAVCNNVNVLYGGLEDD